MVRTQIYLDESQSEQLRERAHAAGLTKSELIRRAVDDYLTGSEDDEAARLSRFREAVRETAGIATYLPPGDEYVADMRSVGARNLAELERRIDE